MGWDLPRDRESFTAVLTQYRFIFELGPLPLKKHVGDKINDLEQELLVIKAQAQSSSKINVATEESVTP